MSNRKLLALLLTVALLPLTSVQADENSDQEKMVVAKKSLTELRSELYKSEEAFYDLFNELNDDDEYDVRCYFERPTGTRIKNHVCRANFVADAFAAFSARSRGNVSSVANQSANPEFAKKSAIFEEKLGSTVDGSPELQLALQKYNEARAQFALKRESSGSH